MLSERMNNHGGSPMDVWIPRISSLWSAATDDKCHAPSSDDYRDWTLLQLKREIAQRNLKIDQRKRNKDAYAQLLAASDGALQHAGEQPTGISHIESVDIQRVVSPQASSQQAMVFPALAQTTQIQPIRRPALPFPVVAPTQQPQSVRRPVAPAQAIQHVQVTPDASPQQLQMQKPPSRVAVPKQPLAQPQLSQPVSVVTDEDEDSDAPVELVAVQETRCTSLQKRKRVTNPGESMWQSNPSSKKQHEYMGHKLAIKAAKVDIQTRRLDMESKRDKQSHELQQVQLELAHEQLKQAKLSTQKIRIDWMVEQALQKKRLRDAGISEQDIAAIV